MVKPVAVWLTVTFAVSGCDYSNFDEQCYDPGPASPLVYAPWTIAASDELVTTVFGDGTHFFATSVSAAGREETPVQLPSPLYRGKASVGVSSVVWHGNCGPGMNCACTQHPFLCPPRANTPCTIDDGVSPLQVTFVREGTAAEITIADDTPTMHSIVFADGGYQVFWKSANAVIRHRTLSETGALGPVHDLGTHNAYCLFAVDDDLGSLALGVAMPPPAATFVALVDAGTGMTLSTWPLEARADYSTAFWFAGELHVLHIDSLYETHLWSIDPTTGVSRPRTLPPDLVKGRWWEPVPSRASLFVPRLTGVLENTIEAAEVLELDASLQVSTRHPMPGGHLSVWWVGAMGTDWVAAEKVSGDLRTPGRIDLVRRVGGTETETWRQTVATDAPLVDLPPDCN